MNCIYVAGSFIYFTIKIKIKTNNSHLRGLVHCEICEVSRATLQDNGSSLLPSSSPCSAQLGQLQWLMA